MSEHTPGPWYVAPNGSTVCHESGSPPFTICDVRNDANARLIAAAPDLLAALRVLSQWCIPQYLDPYKSSIARQALAAIAKAERPAPTPGEETP